MSIKTDITTPENTLNYMKYVEIENDTRYPPVTTNQGQLVFNKSAILTQSVDPLNLGIISNSGTTVIEKFGSNLSVEGDLETIWEPGGLYDYLDVAATVSVVSDQIEDSLTGIGAHEIEILGLDSNYNTITERISTNTTNGTLSGAPSTQEFLRIYRARLTKAGSKHTNDGNLHIKAGNTIIIAIGSHGTGSNREGFGQSQLGVYTVPAGKTGYITQWTVGTSVYNSGIHAYLVTRQRDGEIGGIVNTRDVIFTSQYSVKDYKTPIRVDEKTDIEVRGYNESTGIPVSTTFNVVLIDKLN